MISGAIPIFCKISTESLILPLQRKIKVRENSFSEIIFYAMSELLYNAYELIRFCSRMTCYRQKKFYHVFYVVTMMCIVTQGFYSLIRTLNKRKNFDN